MRASRWNAERTANRQRLRGAGLLWTAILLGVVLAGGANAAPPTPPSQQNVTCEVSKGAPVAVRAQPSASSVKVAELEPDTTFTAVGRTQDRGWLALRVSGQTRWVRANRVVCPGVTLDRIRVLQAAGGPPQAPNPPEAYVPPGSQPPPPEGQIVRPASTTRPGFVVELDMDRGGSDYSHFDLVRPDPMLCQDRCDKDGRCWAYTYAEPGLRSTGAHCWLKSIAPAARPLLGFVSGVKVKGMYEVGYDRPGLDYTSFSVPAREGVNACAARCNADARCWAYTFDKSLNWCWLKVAGPAAVSKSSCISGLKVFGNWP